MRETKITPEQIPSLFQRYGGRVLIISTTKNKDWKELISRFEPSAFIRDEPCLTDTEVLQQALDDLRAVPEGKVIYIGSSQFCENWLKMLSDFFAQGIGPALDRCCFLTTE